MDDIRIGVFICHCGTNIAGNVDVIALKKFSKKLPNVAYSDKSMFMCSEEGQKLIKNSIQKNKLNRVVVASCTPKLHEPTFRRVLSESGLNPYFFEMTNIREDVSWVHNDKKRATEKAKQLIRAGVKRAHQLESIDKKKFEVEQSVIIIGAGVAGIQAGLDTSSVGIKTFLLEKNPSIGGMMGQLVKTFPTNDCALCILSPKMADVLANKNIEIFAYSEVMDVEGFVGNFKVTVKKKARYVDSKKCISCGKCSEKCPVEIPNEWDLGLSKRKSIYLQYPQSVPRTYTIDAKNCLKLTKNKCGICKKICPADAIDYQQKDEIIELKVGAVIIATGTEEFQPNEIKQYGFGKYNDVITQLQLARMLDPSGPTNGRVRCSNGIEPKKYLMVQCVGSRDEKYFSYCSRVCCMSAIKHAFMIRYEQDSDAEIYICYIDIRSFGKGYEEYYKRASELGIKFIRGKVSEILQEKNSLIGVIEDTDIGEIINIKPDMIVLSTPLIPPTDNEKIAKLFGVGLGANKFFRERHPKLAPVDTNIDGIYICGCAQSPKDIPDSVSQARAAAMAASSLILKKQVNIDLSKAIVNMDLCDGCGKCVEICYYNAVILDGTEGKKYAKIIEVACKGCGICAAECSTGAIELRHYKNNQMLAQVDGICGDING